MSCATRPPSATATQRLAGAVRERVFEGFTDRALLGVLREGGVAVQVLARLSADVSFRFAGR